MKITSTAFRQRLKRLRLSVEKLRARRIHGQREVAKLGEGLEIAGHRPYTQGDDMRYLDWNAYGRLEELVLKTFEAPNQVSVLLVIDHSPTMAFGRPQKTQLAAELAAAIGVIALYSGDSLLLANPNGQRREYRSTSQEFELLSEIESILKSTPVAPSKLLHHARERMRSLRGDVLCVFLSDFQESSACQRFLKDVTNQRAKSLLLQLYAEEEFAPELEGNFALSLLKPDGESESTKATITPEMLERYQEELTHFRTATSHFCRRLGVPRYEMLSTAAMEDVILELVSAGLMRVAKS